MIQNLLNSDLSESRAIRTSQDAIHGQLLAFLHKLHEVQDQMQVALRSLDLAADPSSRLQARSLSICSDELSEALQPTKPSIPRSRVRKSSSSIVGMTVQQIDRKPCRWGCSCKCHIRAQWRSHPILKNILGYLFFGYCRTPRVTPDCDRASCHSYHRVFATVFYVFPQWFLQRIVLVAISYANKTGLEISIRTTRERSTTDAIWVYIKNRDLSMVQSLFKKGEASPFDILASTGVSILGVHSSPFIFWC